MSSERDKVYEGLLKKYEQIINHKLDRICLIDSGISRSSYIQKKFKKTFFNDKVISPHGEIVGKSIALYASNDCFFYSFLAEKDYSDVIYKLYEAIDKGINLINISMDTVIKINTEEGLRIYQKWKNAIKYADSKKVTIVCSAGNYGINLDDIYPYMVIPAMFSTVITVGALNSNYERADYSNFGTCVNEFIYGGDCLYPIKFKMDNGKNINTFGTSISAGIFSGIISNINKDG